ncbi:MAG TPA: hypothetical protein VFY73_25490 [Ideonella sp.]|uniref:hypothetical protein n=1 Tax=Ideonella sp. TaxID=1929293 RepID=UPI002E37582B|nr:hypothetical protein [Ideonella sp.]HEX5687384.1 hypothetical protein [Ideonella sp.]
MRTPTLTTIVNWLLGFAGAVNLISGTAYMVLGNATLGAAAVTAGLVLLLASTVDRFETLKGLGIEAKTRELRKTIDEADAVVARMKRLAEVTGSSVISLHASTGRLGGVTPPRRGYELSRSVKEILEGVGASHEAVRDALLPWAQHAALDVARDIFRSYESFIARIVAERRKVVDAFPRPIKVGEASYQEATDALREAQSYAASLDVPDLQSPNALADRLRDTLSHVPQFAPEDARQYLQREVETWAPEFDYLYRNLDYRDPSTWIARLNKVLHIKEIDT